MHLGKMGSPKIRTMLWSLISDEGDAVRGYCDMLDNIDGESEVEAIFRKVIQEIIDDERDHLHALEAIYNASAGDNPVRDMQEAVKSALEEYKATKKLIR